MDFTIEVERALRVLDGAILLICAASGVQPQTLTVDKQMKRYNVPRLVFINKLDRLGADPWGAIEQLRGRLGLTVAAVQANIGIENGLNGVIDLISMKANYFEGKEGTEVVEKEIPADLVNFAEEKRAELIDSLALIDPEVEELFFAEEEITEEVIHAAIRRQTIALKFCPVFMGAAVKNKGVQCVLDAVTRYLPAPNEVENTAFLRAKGSKD